MNDKKPNINLYSDGGADPNPGKGGFGVILEYNQRKKEFSQGYQLTTNNRMELLAIIHGLTQIKKPAIVEVYTDSQYIVNAINKGWAIRWKENNWYRNKKEKAVNTDLWDLLLAQLMIHRVNFHWVKGHNGHPENERCDDLATAALNSDSLIVDSGYLHAVNNESNSGKIKKEGDLCRKCNTPVIKRERGKKKYKEKQNYYFEYFILCPNCNTPYMVEEAKRKIDRGNTTSLFD